MLCYEFISRCQASAERSRCNSGGTNVPSCWPGTSTSSCSSPMASHPTIHKDNRTTADHIPPYANLAWKTCLQGEAVVSAAAQLSHRLTPASMPPSSSAQAQLRYIIASRPAERHTTPCHPSRSGGDGAMRCRHARPDWPKRLQLRLAEHR